jgi:16S rRNA processing protein RimM
MQLDDYFEIGFILKPHGLKGAVNMLFDVDDPTKYKGMESVVVKIDTNLIPFFISSIQINGKKGIIKLEDINSLETAEELKSCPLMLPLELLPKLGKNQFYYHDVIGYNVIDDSKGSLGVIEHIYTGGIQDLISMKYKSIEVLIPVTDGVVKHADHEKHEIFVNLPEGLLEIYLES